MKMQDIRTAVQELTPYVVALRRDFHQHPELSGQETDTRGRILRELETIGLSCEEREGNVYAILEGAAPGKTVVLRADFDALPAQEETELPFCSQTPGVMHACGHDAHIAMLLGVARILTRYRSELKGRVVFLFQYGEELGRGAAEAIAYLEGLDRVDAVLGTHVMSDIPTGQMMVRPGPVMSGGGGFQLEVTGRGGHGASPWASVDPIRPLCDILLRYTSLNVNRFDVFNSFVVSPCVIHSGTVANVIPDKAAFQATIRVFQTATYETLRGELTKIADTVAESYHAKAELLMGPCQEPVVNDPELSARLRPLVERVEGLTLSDHSPFMLSDNFSMILNRFKGIYCFLGVGNEEKGSTYAHHHPKFQIDESALPLGVEFMARGAVELLAD